MGDAELASFKDVLRAGRGSEATVLRLQTLLQSPSSNPTNIATSTGQRTSRNAQEQSQRKGGQVQVKSRKAQPVVVQEDDSTTLSARQQYTLATEVVNICLKVLAEAPKCATANQLKTISSQRLPLEEEPRASPLSHRALQSCSGNSTPSKQTPINTKQAARASPTASCRAIDAGSSMHIVHTAECAQYAFSYLRSTNPKHIGVREMPEWQLERGLLSLSGSLWAHGLEHMSLKALRHVKRRLEAHFASPVQTKMKKPSTHDGVSRERESIATLLQLECSPICTTEALAVATTYQSRVLRILAQHRKPAVIEEAVEYLETPPNSPINLIIRQMEDNGNTTRAAKQLDQLSQTLLSMCPSICFDEDRIAQDPTRTTSPRAVFQLQTLALCLRHRWWTIAKHDADVAKELMDPFWKFATAFIRRNSKLSDAGSTYQNLVRSFKLVSAGYQAPKSPHISCVDVYNTLSLAAEEAEMYMDAEKWTKMMSGACGALEENHALRLIAMTRESALLIKCSSSRVDMKPMLDHLTGAFTGTTRECDLLLTTLEDLTKSLSESEPRLDLSSVHQLSAVAAKFALKYARAYPSRNSSCVLRILDAALRASPTTDALLHWITRDVAVLFSKTDILTSIANDAATKALSLAWTASATTLSFSRMLQVLILKGIRSKADSNNTVIFDDESLSPSQRGILLEWQLMYCLDLVNKAKYRETLTGILPELLRSLSVLYAEKDFPIRRARVAVAVLRLRESYPEILPPHLLKTWQDASLKNGADLAGDAGLQGFYEDTKAALAVSQSFRENRPSVRDLRPSLLLWNQICDECITSTQIRQRIHDPKDLFQQLRSIAAYFEMLGEDETCLATRKLILKLAEICDEPSCTLLLALLDLARQYLNLGYAEEARSTIERADTFSKADTASPLTRADYHIVSAECFVLTENLERCRMALEKANEQRSQVLHEKMSEHEKTMLALLYARAWLAQSTCSLEAGEPQAALANAKQSVKIVNKLWKEIESSKGNFSNDPLEDSNNLVDCPVQALTKGVSKLQLQPKGSTAHRKAEKVEKGASFWSLVPILCKALLHLSDMYVHHGIFHESNYYSQRAIHVAESVGSTALLSRVRSHRSRLLLLAGRIQDAELCLAHDEKTVTYEPSLALVERYFALASVRRQDDPREAISLYERAETVLDCITKKAFMTMSESFTEDISKAKTGYSANPLESPTQTVQSRDLEAETATKSRRAATGKTRQKQDPQRPVSKPKLRAKTTADADSDPESCHVLEKMRVHIRVHKALTQVALGYGIRGTQDQAEQFSSSAGPSFEQLHARYQELMQKASKALKNDVVLSVLHESTLCMPALEEFEPVVACSKVERSASSAMPRTKSAVKSAVKTSKKEAFAQGDFGGPLLAARTLLMKTNRVKFQSHGTSNVHRGCAMLLKTGSLLSSISKPSVIQDINSQTESLLVDLPRSRALESERYATSLNKPNANSGELAWPLNDSHHTPTGGLSADAFQRDFVDILPKSWTAVSLCLNEDASELYIARYNSGKQPLILRLPFSRHKPDTLDEEVFDFHQGKAELQEIIDLSNYSCHNPGNVDMKTVKAKWWSERQALDRRLQELLINIENIWFGGFRGAFSQFAENADEFSCFRKAFEDILDRYLPSRQTARRQTAALSLNDRVLELFIGLGHDYHGAVDLDEPLCDLLYFVVDMLQFGGERNAYDEIDFDSMAVEVLDALRSYHDGSSVSKDKSQHLILVLDRRLQAFPWESLPCMEASNVSRVGSMLSLRERILAQRSSQDRHSQGGSDITCAVPMSGTYILNPSSDLPKTQAMLEPTLSKLNKGWDRIVAQEPDEAVFTSAITNSSILLYFGHGPGSQYIRPGTIRRQATCCNVAWLMGCSSGAVTENGDLEPSSVPLAYMLAGAPKENASDVSESNGLCKAVVATLWDVTDKDIDRFSLRLGEEWGLWPPSEDSKLPTKTTRKRDVVAAPSTPQRAPKTPKTPKVLKSPAPFKTPARDRGKTIRRVDQRTSLVEALSRSREACYLRYLNGAAPVIYGIPVYLDQ